MKPPKNNLPKIFGRLLALLEDERAVIVSEKWEKMAPLRRRKSRLLAESQKYFTTDPSLIDTLERLKNLQDENQKLLLEKMGNVARERTRLLDAVRVAGVYRAQGKIA